MGGENYFPDTQGNKKAISLICIDYEPKFQNDNIPFSEISTDFWCQCVKLIKILIWGASHKMEIFNDVSLLLSNVDAWYKLMSARNVIC